MEEVLKPRPPAAHGYVNGGMLEEGSLPSNERVTDGFIFHSTDRSLSMDSAQTTVCVIDSFTICISILRSI